MVLFLDCCSAAAIKRSPIEVNGCSFAKPSAITSVKRTEEQEGSVLSSRDQIQNTGNEIELTFTLPKNSMDCRLEINLMTGLGAAISSNQRIDFWSIPNQIGTQPTWNSTSSMTKRLGTVTIQPNMMNVPIGSCHCSEIIRVRACLVGKVNLTTTIIPQSALEGSHS